MFFKRVEPDNKLLSELSVTVVRLRADIDRLDESLKAFKGRFYQHVGQEHDENEAEPERKGKTEKTIKPFNPFA